MKNIREKVKIVGETAAGAGIGAASFAGGGRLLEMGLAAAIDTATKSGPNVTCFPEVVAGFAIAGTIVGGLIGYHHSARRN